MLILVALVAFVAVVAVVAVAAFPLNIAAVNIPLNGLNDKLLDVPYSVWLLPEARV